MSKSIKLKDNTYWDTEGITHNQQVLKDYLNNLVLESVYPIGSLYMSINATSPATLFGGTWERMTGGFLYGCVNSPGNGNGTGTSTNSHTLVTNEIPNHIHGGNVYFSANPSWREQIKNYPCAVFGSNGTITSSTGVMAGGENRYTWDVSSSKPYTYAFTMPSANTSATGGGQGHSHNVPYMAVYVWKRTA